MKHSVYLGLGSNLGDRIEFLSAAILGIADWEKVVIDAVSNVYLTEPVGDVQQNDFLNLCISVKTDLEHVEFHHKVKELENRIGRTISVHWGPREIDIDLLFFDSLVVNTSSLTIPHKEILNRKFVLKPLSEIASNFIHPIEGRSIEELNANALDDHKIEYSEMYSKQLLNLINDSITNPAF